MKNEVKFLKKLLKMKFLLGYNMKILVLWGDKN